MPVKFKDYYETLGVSRTAGADEIRKAYRKLAQRFHPDVNKDPSAEARFKEINEAYEVLGDADKRKKYDSLGANWRGGQDFTPPPGWENVHFEFHGAPGAGFDFENLGGGFSDFFEMLFGGGGFGPGASARGGRGMSWAEDGQDQETEITISLEDAYHGAQKQIALESRQADEQGRVRRRVRNYDVRIPAGTTDGARIRLAGQGTPGRGGGEAGDLYLRVHVAPHPVFRVDEHDLHVDLPLAPWEAALGAKVNVPTMAGTASLSIPPRTQSGQHLRLRGKGLPRREGRGPGDLLVTVRIVVPEKLSARERELFEQLARESNFKPRG